MQTADFLRFLWAAASPVRYSIGTKNTVHKRTRFDTVEAAAFHALEAVGLREDVWHSCGVLKPGAQKSGRAEIAGSRAFYLDLDVKSGAYPDQTAAAVAINQFRTAVGLPFPNLVVSSGSGLHIYWVVDQMLTPEAWQLLALRLKALAIERGIHCDAVVTGDIARVLRTPGTLNFKDPSNPKPVRVVHFSGSYIPLQLVQTALPAMPSAPMHLRLPQGAAQSDLAAGLYVEHDRSMADVIRGCAVMQTMLKTGGDMGGYVLWREMLALAACTTDGDKFVRPLSEKHRTFTEDGLSKMWDSTVQRRKAGLVGPARCDTIANEGGQAHICATCPHRAAVNSPIRTADIVMAQRAATTQSPDPAKPLPVPPERFKLDTHGYSTVVFNKKGQGVEVMILLGRVMAISRRMESDKVMLDLLYHPAATRGAAPITVEIAAVGTRENYLRSLGLVIPLGRHKEANDMLVSWSNLLAQAGADHVDVKHYGWIKHGKGHVFAVGDKVIRTDRTDQALNPPRNASLYMPLGSLDDWRAAAQRHHDIFGPGQRAVLASAFAAPLIHFTAQHGGRVLTIYGRESGHGKTTALEVAQSTWGGRDGVVRMATTVNAMPQLAGVLHSLPVFWDEARALSVDRTTELMFMLAEGHDKRRFALNKQVAEPMTWNTLSVIASNYSLRDKAAAAQNAAGTLDEGPNLARVFEVATQRVDTIDASLPDLTRACIGNCGHAGVVYANYLVRNYDEVAKLVGDVEKTLLVHYQRPECRFHCSTIAALVVGAHLSTKLGLIQFDSTAMEAYLRQHMADMLAQSAQDNGPSGRMTPQDDAVHILNNLLASLRNNMLVSRTTSVVPLQVQVVRRPQVLTEIDAHVILDTQELLIDKAKFNLFCSARTHSVGTTLSLLKSVFNATLQQRTMGRHTGVVMGRSQCLVIPLNTHPHLVELLQNFMQLTPTGVAGGSPYAQAALH